MSDRLNNKVGFRTFNVIDDFNCEVLVIDIATSIPALRVIHYLDQLAQWHGYPGQKRTDNGSEFTSDIFVNWAKIHQVRIEYIKLGCPYQNAYIERLNRTYRDDILESYIFRNLNEVKQMTVNWIGQYNLERPHESLNNTTSYEYRNMHKLFYEISVL